MGDKRVDIWNDILAGKKIMVPEWDTWFHRDADAGLIWGDGRPADVLVSEILEAAADYTIYEEPSETIASLRKEVADLKFVIAMMKNAKATLNPMAPIFHPDIGLRGETH